MSMIHVSNIKKSFGKKEGIVHALNGVTLDIERGEMVAIMGKSGSGKSTLLNILGGIINMDSGEYEFNDRKVDFTNQKNVVTFRRQSVGFVVQYFALIGDLNIYENVALPLRYQKKPKAVIKEKVLNALDSLQIMDKQNAFPDELSGGQQQRVAIARAIVKNPHVLLADEPTGALDEQTEDSVMQIFKELHSTGKTIVIVTHDDKVAQMCDRTIYLRDGRIENEA